MLDGNLQTAREAVFMETVLRPSARIADTSGVLDSWQQLLRPNRGSVIQRVMVLPESVDQFWFGGMEWVQRNENRTKRLHGDML